jgi:uncharacterized membrane protein
MLFLWARTSDFLRERKKEVKILLIILLVGLLFGGFGYMHYWLGGVLLALTACTLLVLLWRRTKAEESFIYILLLVGLVISFFCEIFFLDDRYTGKLERYNTVFKFYNPIWHMFAVAFCVSMQGLFGRFRRGGAKVKLGWMYVLLVASVVLGLLYPLASTSQRTRQFNRFLGSHVAGERTIDGLKYLSRLPEYKEDYEVILWINENIKGQPKVLEATGGPYTSYSRISTNTGLITLIGWGHHEAQWRGNKIWGEVGEKEKAIKAIYNTEEKEVAIELIKKYGIDYIYIGGLERKDFDERGFEKFKDFCTPVFQQGSSILYKVNLPG